MSKQLAEILQDSERDLRSSLIWWPGHGWVPAISGGDGTGEENEDGNEEENEDGNEEEDDEIKDPKAKIKSLQAQVDRLHKKLKKQDKIIESREKEISNLKATNKSSDDKVNERVTELEAEIASKDDEIKGLQTDLLVIGHEKLSGLPERRRKIILGSIKADLEIDDDGDSNLEELIQELESEDPDLFKTKSSSNGDGEEDEEGSVKTKKVPTGKKSNASKGKGGIDRALLEKKYPALRSRR